MSALPEMLMVADRGEVIATVRRHQDILEVFRTMKDRLGLTNEFIDEVGGLTKGHADKILGPTAAKNWGPTTFDLFCEMFAIEFRVHVDIAAAARMDGKWEKRQRSVESTQTRRISKKLLEKAKPLVLKEYGRLGGMVTAHMRTPAQRSASASKAAKSRWRRRRKAGGG